MNNFKFCFKSDLYWYNEIDEYKEEDIRLLVDLVVYRFEGFEGSYLPLDESRFQATKLAIFLGFYEPLISNRLQDVYGDQNLA